MPSDPSFEEDFPALDAAHFDRPDHAKLAGREPSMHPPRILLLHGSLRERSYSRCWWRRRRDCLSVGRRDTYLRPAGPADARQRPADHPKVLELRALSAWSEGRVWCSPERHGTITGFFKSQIDWFSLEFAGIRPTQGRTLAVR